MAERSQLVRELRHQDPAVRRRAARLLDHMTLDAETIEALVEVVRTDTAPKVRGAAVHALVCEPCKPEAGGLPIDLPALLIDVLLNDVSQEVRRHAVDGLRPYDDQPRVMAALRAALNDPAQKVRGKAAYILPFEERRRVRGLA